MRILIAEDEFISRKVLNNMLSAYGDCDIAIDGTEAVTAFKEALATGSPYDLICLDINMPHLSGVQVIEKIREIEKKQGITGSKMVKIAMTTGNSDTESIRGSFNAGCEVYLVKPLSREEVIGKLAGLGFRIVAGNRTEPTSA
jgi:two-component system, chemotaxis family, chemotaxis protein CheY